VASSNIKLRRDIISHINSMLDDFKNETDKNDVNIRNGYRDYDSQMSIYSDYVNKYGLDATNGYIAMGGFSEHHTALGFDLNVYTADGLSYDLDYNPVYTWIYDNCYKYGFVRRFDANKTDITGITGELYHFRYVGKPHAYYMKKNNLVLEEYINELKKYPADGNHLIFSDDEGSKWEIYYAPLTNSGKAKIPVAENADYELSGTNEGGFIVTVKLQ